MALLFWFTMRAIFRADAREPEALAQWAVLGGPLLLGVHAAADGAGEMIWPPPTPSRQA
ncbi:MAG: hypothetical protein M3424_06255 [Actinomycetota bacterium]|nr:hypothetical protein [Actinomycetota bacterium]